MKTPDFNQTMDVNRDCMSCQNRRETLLFPRPSRINTSVVTMKLHSIFSSIVHFSINKNFSFQSSVFPGKRKFLCFGLERSRRYSKYFVPLALPLMFSLVLEFNIAPLMIRAHYWRRPKKPSACLSIQNEIKPTA